MKAVTFETGEIDMTTTPTRAAFLAAMAQHLNKPDSLWRMDRYGNYLRDDNYRRDSNCLRADDYKVRLHLKSLVVRLEVKTSYGEWVNWRSAYFKDVKFDDHKFDGRIAPAIFVGNTPLWLVQARPVTV